jgi:hypothetical protein
MALIKFRALLKDVPQDSLAEATVLLTECLLEQAHVPKPPHWNTLPPRPFWQWREEAELLGAQFVPAAAGGPLPQQVRVIVDEVTTLFRVAAQAGQQGVQGQQQGQLLVVSVEAQERAEKFLTLPGGIRVTRAPDEKTAWMFPHPWITMCSTASVELATVEWHRQIEAYFRAGVANVPELHQEKYQRCIAQQKFWIRGGHGRDVASTSTDQFRVFLNNTEMLLEVFLLSRKPTTASHTTMTSKLWSLVNAMHAKSEPLDYAKAISEAREVKDAAFRPSRQ